MGNVFHFDCYAGMSEDDLQQKCRALSDRIETLRSALVDIAAIESGHSDLHGSDWSEIELARAIANAALSSGQRND